MAVNKVIFGDDTLIDLTADTVTSSALLSSYTAHDKSGALITGSFEDDNRLGNYGLVRLNSIGTAYLKISDSNPDISVKFTQSETSKPSAIKINFNTKLATNTLNANGYFDVFLDNDLWKVSSVVAATTSKAVEIISLNVKKHFRFSMKSIPLLEVGISLSFARK